MIRTQFLIGLFVLFLKASAFSGLEPEFLQRKWIDQSGGMLDLNLISIDLDDSGRHILCATERTVYLSENNGRSWRAVFRTGSFVDDEEDYIEEPDQDDQESDISTNFDRDDYDVDDLYYRGVLDEEEEIDDLSDEELRERLIDLGLLEEPDTDTDEEVDIGDEDPDFIEEIQVVIRQVRWDSTDPRYAYLVTDRGLYRSMDSGHRWEELPANAGPANTGITRVCVIAPEGDVLILQNGKLLISNDHGLTFDVVEGVLDQGRMLDLETDRINGRVIVAITESSVIIASLNHAVLENIRVLQPPIQAQMINLSSQNEIYLGGPTGLYRITKDHEFSEVSEEEISGVRIQDLLVSLNTTILATNRGLYFWNSLTGEGQFHNPGLSEYNVRELALNPTRPEEIWIATATGIFMLSDQTGMSFDPMIATFLPDEYPTLNDVIRASMRHAQIDIARDRNWYNGSLNRIWFPKVEFCLTSMAIRRTNYTRNPEVWISGGKAYTGPVNERYDLWQNDPFDVRLSLSWSPRFYCFDRSDVSMSKRLRSEVRRRNKMLVDIRDKYNKLGRLYMELSTSGNPGRTIDMVLNIQEIEAQINALTGFQFDTLFQKGLRY
ncbi:hypothetical protein JW823_02250 [bacterium]|nr:hypothetical protein [candidate division CSSED10-310 bacterium]